MPSIAEYKDQLGYGVPRYNSDRLLVDRQEEAQQEMGYGLTQGKQLDVTFLAATGGSSVGKFNSMTYVAAVNAYYMFSTETLLTIRRIDGTTYAQTAVGTSIGSAQTRGAALGRNGLIVACPFNKYPRDFRSARCRRR
jgi:hypothetical protein